MIWFVISCVRQVVRSRVKRDASSAVGFVEIVMLLIASVGGLRGLCSCVPVNTFRLGSVVGNWCKIGPTVVDYLSSTVAVHCLTVQCPTLCVCLN